MANTYEIYTSDNLKHYTVNESATNRETPVTLIGHGMPEYGIDQNTNFLHLLENFANEEAPSNPIVGQLWFKKNSNTSNDMKYELCVCKHANGEDSIWDKIAIVSTSTTEPSAAISGDMWYDTHNHSLKVYDDVFKGWNVIGPADAIHKESENTSRVITKEQQYQATYAIDISKFSKDIENENDKGDPSGSLNLVTLKILAKEIFESPDITRPHRSAAWIYKFLIHAYKESENYYNVEMVGRENYELIGITDNTNWTVDLYRNGSEFVVNVQDNDKIASDNSRIVVGFDLDIVRV